MVGRGELRAVWFRPLHFRLYFSMMSISANAGFGGCRWAETPVAIRLRLRGRVNVWV